MADLNEPLGKRMHDLVEKKYKQDASLTNLVNTIVGNQADFEHVVTFLDQSQSGVHQSFASDLREAFEGVLRDQLTKIKTDLGEDPVGLYAALFDMYNVPDVPESLGGVLTTNYDLYIEQALEKAGVGPVDFGFPVRDGETSSPSRIKLVKLHGSFGWTATWPPAIATMDDVRLGSALWIPPGIEKPKQGYPFSVLWGLAREVLACDVLRIIGCRLDGNDWDLVSLLFSTLHIRTGRGPYRVQVVDAPRRTEQLKARHPYLAAESLLEIEDVGPAIVSELTDGPEKLYADLSRKERRLVFSPDHDDKNWFELWLRKTGEAMLDKVPSVKTTKNLFFDFLEE